MSNILSLNSIAPKKLIRGENAWVKGKQLIPLICRIPIIIGRSKSTLHIREYIKSDLHKLGIKAITSELKYDCCELDIDRIKTHSQNNNCDAVIAIGGGKALDSGKLLADRLCMPCITIPTSASTCAGWTALSNIYSPKGAFIRDEILKSCPELLIFDHTFVKQAPTRTLASGIGDALAKWYEASSTCISSSDGLVQQAVQMARILRDQIFIDGAEAIQNPNSDAWTRVAEGCALTAGLIGGLGGSQCRTAAAHALHNGLTQIESSKQSLHGEIVCFGILVQLNLEKICKKNQLASQTIKQLFEFMQKIGLPQNLKELGLEEINTNQLKEACIFACKDSSDIHKLPFEVNANMLLKALITTKEKDSISILQKALEK